MKKRFLCLLLTLCLFASLLSITALADEKPVVKFDFLLSGQDDRPAPGDTPSAKNGIPDVMLDTEAALTMNAGDGAKYYVTTKTDSNFPDNTYLNPGSESNWNVKFDYPADGIPTVTLKDANLVNKFGLWFGGVNIPMTSDIKIVLEGKNHIEYISTLEDEVFPAHGLLNLNTTGTVTITGDGKLTFASDSHSSQTGVITGRGDIVLDHVDIFMSLPDTKGKCNAIHTTGGDVTIKGGSWTVDSYDDPDTIHAASQSSGYRNHQEAIRSAVFIQKRADGTGGNFVVEDGANVLLMVSPTVNKMNSGIVMYTEGAFIIKDSTVEIGLIGQYPSGVSLFKEKPTFEYTDDTYYIIATQSKQAEYSPDALTLTPATEKAVDWFNFKKVQQLSYFKVSPGGEGGPTCLMPVAEETTPTTTAHITVATTTPITKPTTNTTDATDATNATTAVDNNTTAEDKQGGMLWLYILLGVIALAGGAVLVVILIKRNATTSEEAIEETQEETEETESSEETETTDENE